MTPQEQNIKKKSKLSDQQLINAYKKGDAAALSQLIERHHKRILHYIRILIKDYDLANDVFQETFIKVVRSIDDGRYADNGKFLPWVLRIAHNQVIDHFRQTKTEATVSHTGENGYDLLNHPRYSDKNVEENLINTQMEQDIRKLVEKLPDEQREVVQMRYFNGLSFKEIAETTDVSINTALGRMRYALINLRKMMLSQEEGI